MGNGHQPGEVHALSRMRRRLQDRALPPSRHHVGQAHRLRGGRGRRRRRLHVPGALQPVRRRPVRARLPHGGVAPARGRHRRHRLRQVHRLPLLRDRLPLPEPHLLLEGQGPGVLPRLRAHPLREDGPEALPASERHHREVQLLRRAHRRRHVARPDCPASTATPRRHASTPARPGRSRSATSTTPTATSTSCCASTTASSCAPSTAPTRRSGTSTTGSAATTTGRRARRRRAATSSTSAPWTATRTGASSAATRTTRR